MKEQKVLVILKPDCVARGLTDTLITDFKQSGLKILVQNLRLLTVTEINSLYEEHRCDDTFPSLVEYMLEGPCVLLVLSGANAVVSLNKMKGRTGSGRGIRGKYAQDFIRNIVHVSETAYKTKREILIFFPEEDVSMNSQKLIIGLSGMTESGKSTAGKFFDTRGVKRLKIAEVLDKVRLEHSPNETTNEFVDRILQTDPVWLRLALGDKLLEEMERMGIQRCSLESMGDPETVRYLQKRFPGEFISVYIDATLENRLRYQMIRLETNDEDLARRTLIPKDKFKESFWRMPAIKEIADVVVDNNGTLDGLLSQLENILVDKR